MSRRRWYLSGTLILGTFSATLLALMPLAPVRAGAGWGNWAARPVGTLPGGGFEAGEAGWEPYGKGYLRSQGGGRGGSAAAAVECDGLGPGSGVGRTLTLDQTMPFPLKVSAWSRAENVDGSPDADYALYLDVAYADGSSVHGLAAPFSCGTHGWERREILVPVTRAVRSLTLHCLLRHHRGKAWFDDVQVEELRGEPSSLVFQGAPLRFARSTLRPAPPAREVATDDGLKLSLSPDGMSSLAVAGRELATRDPGGFYVRDVQADSDLHGFRDGACPALGLSLETEVTPRGDHLSFRARLRDRVGRDRALTLLFALPVDARGWNWGHDIRRQRLITGEGEFTNAALVGAGATGTLSRYPVAAIYDARTGLALAIDPEFPAQFRLGYHAGTRHLTLAYDVALLPDSHAAPGTAELRFVLYRIDPAWGFRAALQKLYAIFPDAYAARVREHGIWMPFGKVGRVRDPEDFGFRFHEGDEDVAGDDARGVLSFRYSEPMAWWVPMPREVPRTGAAAREALAGREGPRLLALEAAGARDAAGGRAFLFRSEPWCDGAVWSLNPSPSLPGPVNAATLLWNEEVKARNYGPRAAHELDGEFLDSLEGHRTADLDFHREHLRHAATPLTFSGSSRQPAVLNGLAAFELVRWLAKDLRPMGKFLFSNGVPRRFGFLCPYLDVLGMETNWMPGGRYEPESDEEMALWRSLAYQKPFLLLQNADFDAFTSERVESYLRRSLFYGMFPSMFSANASDRPYWDEPRWVERDRALFKKYVPLIRRAAIAGWQPVTGATCDNPLILVERFGPDAGGVVYFTLLNAVARPQDGTLTLPAGPGSRKEGRLVLKDLISGRPLEPEGRRLAVTLGPDEVWLVEAACRE